MARRLYKTTADYLAIAVSPALIMALVTSLVFFLLLVFYRGEFQHRLQYILFLFVFAAVLIARIAMEEGRERAMLYSVLLAIAVAITVNRFSDLSPLVNFGLLGLIWWCADRLTWDCTLIDDHEDATGEGLLQTVGLDEPLPNGRPAHVEADVEPWGVTSREAASLPQPGWRRWWRHFHKTRAPGVWVVYFSLAALPIFGLGQRFVAGAEARQTAFWYLVIYVASALGLLLATCFLGLRRYLRQRRVEMPDKMAVVWVATGCALIVALLAVCTLLPRRNPVLELADRAPRWQFGSPTDLTASWLGWGDEGARQDPSQGPMPGAKRGNPDEESTDGASSGTESSGKQSADEGATGASSAGQRKPSPSGSSGAEREKPGQPPSEAQSSASDATRTPSGKSNAERQTGAGESSANGSQSPPDQARQVGGAPTDEAQRGGNSPSPENKNRSQSSANEQGQPSSRPPDDSHGARQTPPQEAQAQTASTRERSSQPPPSSASKASSPPEAAKPLPREMPRPSWSLGAWLNYVFGWMGILLRWAFYAALVVVGVVLFRKYKDELLAGFRDLFRDLRRFWDWLLGKQRPAAAPAAVPLPDPGPKHRPFASFADPFASGKQGRYAAEQLVKYTFEALEAWARERGCARRPEQTPHEFAHAVGRQHAAVARPAQVLADLYARLAYAPDPLPPSSVPHLREVWSVLRTAQPLSDSP